MPGSTTAVYQEIVSVGPQDAVLVGLTLAEAAITFWRFVHMKYTPFAIEPVEFDVTSGTVAFGSASSATANVKFSFPRNGDLIWCLFAKITLPGIFGADLAGGTGLANTWQVYNTEDTEPYWTDAIGQYVLSYVEFTIGGTVIDQLYNWYLYAWEELSGKPGKRLREMIGKYDTVCMRQAKSRATQILYVPLNFHFTQNTGLALPIVSLQFHNVAVNVQFAPLNSCIVTPFAPTTPATAIPTLVYKRPQNGLPVSNAVALSNYSHLSNTDLQCAMEGFFVYLDHDERSKFAHGQFEQITTEIQFYPASIPSTNGSVATAASAAVQYTIQPVFNNVVMEYILCFQRNSNTERNDHFNFSGPIDAASELSIDPIREMAILFNNNERVRKREAQFFRLVEPYVHHTNVPSDFIYCFSYAVEPEDSQPTGGANHSRIDNVALQVWVDPRMFNEQNGQPIVVNLAGRSYNLLRFKHGLTTKKF